MAFRKGSITVFLSLLCMLFLAVLCSVTESARVAGAKAQSAQLTGAGLYSSLAWFEKNLLEEYELLGVDGTCGGGWFSERKLERRLLSALEKSASPGEVLPSRWTMDLWRLSVTDARVTEYALLTDGKGEVFYQQAVAYMKECFPAALAQQLQLYKQEAREAEESAEKAEELRKQNEDDLESLERVRKEREKELREEAEQAGEAPPGPSGKNLLAEMTKLRFRNILKIVTGGCAISKSSLTELLLPSKRIGKKGSMKLEKRHGGPVDDLLFREYLLQHFGNYRAQEEKSALRYETEYLIAGKRSDELNLKSVAGRLVALREGMNYLYCVEEGSISSRAGTLAFALTGFLGIPAITAATKHALLFALAYGESLLDVKDLMNGGKIPLHKTDASWALDPEDLGNLTAMLNSKEVLRKEGLSYRDYLRILLILGSVRKQRLRALDLIESNLRKLPGTSGFKAENCVTGIRVRTDWKIRPLFWSLASTVTGIRGVDVSVQQNGALAYDP